MNQIERKIPGANPAVKNSTRSLRAQYRVIGRALLDYEVASGYLYHSFPAFTSFREDVAFSPVEVLESYLEDLLDADCPENSLYIAKQRKINWTLILAGLGLSTALGAGLYMASLGVALSQSFLLTAIIALPFAIIWHFVPKNKAHRRMKLAHVVSSEVIRRRGSGNDEDGRAMSGFVFSRLFGQAAGGSGSNRAMFV